METIKAWQCIGCGRLEAPAQCVGVCQDRPVDLVDAAELRAAEAAVAALEGVLRRIAHTHPRPGRCEATWRALQAEAQRVLETHRPGGGT